MNIGKYHEYLSEFIEVYHGCPNYYFEELEKSYEALDNARGWMEGLYEAIYEKGSVEEVHRCMEELQDILKANFSVEGKEPKIENKEKNKLFNWALGYQKAQLDNLMNTSRTIENYI